MLHIFILTFLHNVRSFEQQLCKHITQLILSQLHQNIEDISEYRIVQKQRKYLKTNLAHL